MFAEEFAEGHSIRRIAQHHVLSRHKVTDLVNEGLDLYADLRGFRQRQNHPRISVRLRHLLTSVTIQVDDDVTRPGARKHERAHI